MSSDPSGRAWGHPRCPTPACDVDADHSSSIDWLEPQNLTFVASLEECDAGQLDLDDILADDSIVTTTSTTASPVSPTSPATPATPATPAAGHSPAIEIIDLTGESDTATHEPPPALS
ncbi:hypothetical protein MN608_09450 [Microdochium nivale]|nr:hypothetical protein MN608_09450 [Microdochium nivale]